MISSSYEIPFFYKQGLMRSLTFNQLVTPETQDNDSLCHHAHAGLMKPNCGEVF